jgi:hydroxyacylglutathione hydrolase
MAKLDILPIGLYEENSMVLHDHGHVLLIDPGRYPEKIAAKVGPQEIVDAIVLTHGHSDHTMAADDLADQYHCPIYLHPLDRALVAADSRHLESTGYPLYHETQDLADGAMTIGTFPVTVYHTPGHTAGSVCICYRNLLFTGDTLFAGDCGRTDLYSGDEAEMQKSLHRLAALSRDLQVYPGHGPSSTISGELKVNPYLQSA